MDLAQLYFAGVVLLGYVLQTAMGFGSMLVCITLGVAVLTVPEIVTLAVPISLVQTGYIAIRHRSGIRWPLLLWRVLPLMGLGMAAGYMFLADAAGIWLKPAFGCMVLLLSARELTILLRARASESESDAASGRSGTHLASGVALLCGGVVHGIYATGGPLLVYALEREGLGKYAFRSTLAAVWLVLNVVLTVSFATDGRYEAHTLKVMAMLLPAAPIGIAIGEFIHRRVDERRFKIIVFTLLILAAFSLIAN